MDVYHKRYYLKHRQSLLAYQKQYNHKHHNQYIRNVMLGNARRYIRTIANLEQLMSFKKLINNRLRDIKEDD